MKNIRSVFILLIGMISLTAFATTSKLDQKPTTALTIDHSVVIVAVNVAPNFDVVSITKDSAFSQCIFIENNQSFVQQSLVIITDVGWYSRGGVNSMTIFNEKLKAKSRLTKPLNRNFRSNC